MILVEFREDLLNKALDELEKAKSGIKESKMALCNVEDSIYELYEAHKESNEEIEDYVGGDEFDTELNNNDIEVNYRRRRGMRGSMRMRNSSGMRGGMRMRHSSRYMY